MTDFAQKYDAVPFDENDENNQVAELARKSVISSQLSAMQDFPANAPRHMEFLLAGLLVGLVQVMKASAAPTCDQTDASIRASILEMTPWAVDFARETEGQNPLSDGN